MSAENRMKCYEKHFESIGCLNQLQCAVIERILFRGSWCLNLCNKFASYLFYIINFISTIAYIPVQKLGATQNMYIKLFCLYI